MKADVLTLISVTSTQDELGQFVNTEKSRDVFCEIKSASRAEFFAGGAVGLTPSLVATMFAFDYEGESLCSYEGERYSIYRTYRKTDDDIELYLKREAGTNG